ncbi:MAG: hypothetical protein R3A80_10570 [Bdellovibrionota bacterium]
MKNTVLLNALSLVFMTQVAFAEKGLGTPIEELSRIKARVYVDRATDKKQSDYSRKLNNGLPPPTSFLSYWDSQTYEVHKMFDQDQYSVVFTRFSGAFLGSTLSVVINGRSCLERFVEDILENPKSTIHYKFEFLDRYSYNRTSIATGLVKQDVYFSNSFFYKPSRLPSTDTLLNEECHRSGHTPSSSVYLGSYGILSRDLWVAYADSTEIKEAVNLDTFCIQRE